MTGTKRITTVCGQDFEVWSDFIKRGTFARSISSGAEKQINGSGYIRNDLTVRKAIANSFGLSSFKK